LIHRPDTALEMLMRAYKVAATGRPGPVVLQIPFDIQHTEIEIKEIPEPRPWVNICEPGPDSAGIQEAAKLILKAERPYIVVSSGIHSSLAHEQLKSFAEAFGIPVGTIFLGKGAFPEDHELSVGVVGRNGTGQAIKAAQNCDLLIAIGTHFSDFDTGGWTLYDILSYQIDPYDIDPTEISRVYPTEVATADVKLALRPSGSSIEWPKKSKVAPGGNG
jgi:acetolactate synthase-1/2/3 large subunit